MSEAGLTLSEPSQGYNLWYKCLTSIQFALFRDAFCTRSNRMLFPVIAIRYNVVRCTIGRNVHYISIRMNKNIVSI